MPASVLKEKILHRSFQLGILLKGIDGFLETVGGFLFLFISQGAITRFVFSLTRPELLEDPDDAIANTLRRTFGHLSGERKLLVAAYLLGHGIVKLLLVAGLWRNKRWVFPIALAALAGFIACQGYRLISHFSVSLLLLTVLDVVIAALVWHEYRTRRG